MKTIGIRQDFGVYDISDEEDVSKIIEKIDIEGDNDVQLNLSGCLIDYPATSKILDKILNQLSSLSGDKRLDVITDYILPMQTVVNWLFLGSRLLNMESNTGLEYNTLIQTIKTTLQRSNIFLKIIIKDNTEKVIDEVSISE